MIQFKNEYLTVYQSALYQTTCSVVEGKDFVLVVDPNWLPNEIAEIQAHIARIQGQKELYLLFTHGDFDHIIGYKAFPNAKIIGSKGLENHLHKEQKVEMIHDFYNRYYIQPPYPIEFPKVDIVVKVDGQKMTIGDTTFTFYLSPGHTEDGLFTIIEPLGIWIAGDYLSDFELPFVYNSAMAYQKTLKKAEQIHATHHVTVLVPGHGRTTTSQEEIKRRIQRSQNYLENLISAVMEEDTDKQIELEKEMAFPSSFTKQCHEENISIIKKEFK